MGIVLLLAAIPLALTLVLAIAVVVKYFRRNAPVQSYPRTRLCSCNRVIMEKGPGVHVKSTFDIRCKCGLVSRVHPFYVPGTGGVLVIRGSVEGTLSVTATKVQIK